jgi:23S rRNA pseudouridine1911/1915/1917 synthase
MLQVHVLARVWRFKSSRRHMKKIIITEESAGERIDKFLKQEVFLNSEITRGEIIRAIRNGFVKINKLVIKPSYILKERDVLNVAMPKKAFALLRNPKIRLKIIFKDKNIIVIDKPAGLKVHPNDFSETDALANALIAKFPEILKISDGSRGSELRPGIVHRLDKDTSGLMVVARNQKAFDELKKLFQEKNVRKTYLAIVRGKMPQRHGVIEKPLARSSNYKKQVIANRKTKTKVREAITEFKVLGEFADHSLVEVRPKTGRTHQIRIHFSSIGNPVAGDKTYGLKFGGFENKPVRQMLHAQKLEFELFGETYSFLSELPKDFHQYLESLDEMVIKR